jgi:cell wall-associated NlpC family hydrolase
MKRKRLITIGVIALVLTIGTAEAFGAVIKASEVANKQQEVTQVTKPAEVIDSPVRKEILVSGLVRNEEPAITVVLKSQAPEVGSVDWMAQEKAEKDKLKSDAELKEAELEAEIERLEAELEAEINRQAKIKQNTEKLNKTLELVKNQIGKTPWVFQGSSTRAWDCSGLVRWTYAQIGIDLYHSASTQRNAGTIVTEPKLGDLVSFNHKGWKSAYHIGIYLSPDKMIHSGGKPGDRTEIRSISGWAKDNGGSGVVYTRIVETNN